MNIRKEIKTTFKIRKYTLMCLYTSILFLFLTLFNIIFFNIALLFFVIFLILSKLYWKCPRCGKHFPLFKLDIQDMYTCVHCKRRLINPPIDLTEYKKSHC
jgi:DNA-directed RNA polymerase subunit RPC12/RpoP